MKGESVLQKQIIIDPDEIRKLLAPWGYDKTNKNMLHRGVNEGRFLPCLYFLNGMLMQSNRPKEVTRMFDGTKGFTYMGIDNTGNVTKERLLDAKEAERAFDYDITLSQITKMLEYGREYLDKEREN